MHPAFFPHDLKNLTPRISPNRIIGISTPGDIGLQHLLYNILIQQPVNNGRYWYIRPIFRPFVDSPLLPKSDKYVFPETELDGGENP
ncbi:MAG: hypothetical protein A4E38_01596 [Methanoregulaceae archaeon PtaB.Bin108]|nr:MAG: hypothetical protein A4E38_01596 [Methanoregulaceae archaeon PtaB.Bin108]